MSTFDSLGAGRSILVEDPEKIPMDRVVLVDEQDRAIGTMGKLDAHRNGGHLHRAFSIFVFNNAGEVLLQQRSWQKYHFGGLWANTCCSHPRPNENVIAAAHRRLQEEFGFDCDLKELFSFVYRADDADSGLSEYEYDHVIAGRYEGSFSPAPEEIADWRWAAPEVLMHDIELNPHKYTLWLRIALRKLLRGEQPISRL